MQNFTIHQLNRIDLFDVQTQLCRSSLCKLRYYRDHHGILTTQGMNQKMFPIRVQARCPMPNLSTILRANARGRVRSRPFASKFCRTIRSLQERRRSLSPTTATDWSTMYPSPSAIDVTPLAASLRSRVREYTRKNGKLKLIGILANEGSHRMDSQLYSEHIQQRFEEDGIDYEVWEYPEENTSISEQETQKQEKMRWIESRIEDVNGSKEIDGVLVFYPIYPFGPKGPYKNKLTGVYYKTEDHHIRDLVDPSKDVEGLSRNGWVRMRDSKPPATYPCTALSVLRILEEYHINNFENGMGGIIDSNDIAKQNHQCWKDQTISIVNRSEIVGRPLAVMLAEKGATVYSIDIDSILQFRPDGKRVRRCSPQTNLESCLRESNVVVAGVPKSDFRLPLSSIPEGSMIVNVAEFPNVCEETLFRERPDIKYIPQVGKVTVASLSTNLMNLKLNRVDRD